MKKKLRFLIIDNYPMTAYGYELSIKDKLHKDILDIQKSFSIDDALNKINLSKGNPFDIYLLDINMIPSKNEEVENGEGLAIKIKELINDPKIIISTSVNNPYKIKSVISTLKPDGFLFKTSITPDILMDAIYAILGNEKYYSETIKRIFKTNSENIDNFDRKILYFISIGEKMKNLPNYIPLSIASIERRKSKIKMQFNIPDCSDRELLYEASKRGYI